MSRHNPITELTEVRESSTHGLGVFAKTIIPKNTIWWRVSPNEIIHVNKANYEALQSSHQDQDIHAFISTILHFSYYVKQYDALLFIPDNGRLVNHSFEPNSAPGVNDCLISSAVRDIYPGDEILEDYTHYDKCSWAKLYGDFGRTIGCW
jgi:SET domain-containing protein